MPVPLPSSHSASIDNDSDSSRTLTRDFDRSLDFTTATDMTSEEYATPNSTLKNMDYDVFKQQMHDEFINNSQQLQTVNDDTLKSHQPIDPSRINDSLKLYSENIMSKSFSVAEQSLRVCPSMNEIQQYQTLAAIDPQKLQDTFGLVRRNGGGIISQNYVLQKSGSASSRIIASENENWMEKGLNRSKSGPNWYEQTNNSSDNEETLKPSTIRKNHEIYNIRMDCYNDIQRQQQQQQAEDQLRENGAKSSLTASTVTTPTTPTTATTITPTTTSDSATSSHGPNCEGCSYHEDGVVLRKHKTGSTAIKRRSGNKR